MPPMFFVNLVTLAAVLSIATPIWYFPFRAVLFRFGYPRAKSGRVQSATLLDWLNATGVGIFGGALLIGWARTLGD
jgi:hypothetical protein